MEIKAKFKCTSHIISNVGTEWETEKISFSVVTSGSEENKTFSKFTPSGEIWINISKDAPSYGQFKQGKEYFVTFTEN